MLRKEVPRVLISFCQCRPCSYGQIHVTERKFGFIQANELKPEKEPKDFGLLRKHLQIKENEIILALRKQWQDSLNTATLEELEEQHLNLLATSKLLNPENGNRQKILKKILDERQKSAANPWNHPNAIGTTEFSSNTANNRLITFLGFILIQIVLYKM